MAVGVAEVAWGWGEVRAEEERAGREGRAFYEEIQRSTPGVAVLGRKLTVYPSCQVPESRPA